MDADGGSVTQFIQVIACEMCFILGEATVDANHNLRRINVGYGVRKVWAFSSVLLAAAFIQNFSCFGVMVRIDLMLQRVKAGCGLLCLLWLHINERRPRSEEHTSELQSLMRISSA